MMCDTDNPTDAALLDSLPMIPVPHSGSSPAIRELLERRATNGFIIGRDGIHAVIRRPWIDALIPITRPIPLGHAYGNAGPPRINLTCGTIPASIIEPIVDDFTRALPNEHAAFIVWNEETQEFSVHTPRILYASPGRLRYEPLATGPAEHIIADIHSHGVALPFWSATDDIDDADQTVLSIVVGKLGRAERPAHMIARLCSRGIFHVLRKSPTAPTSNVVFNPSPTRLAGDSDIKEPVDG